MTFLVQAPRVEWTPATFSSTPHRGYLMAKRATDFTLSAVALILLSPVFLIIAVVIKLDDGGPVFFTQKRVGEGQRTFTMFKFRTMRTDAEACMAELLAQQRHDPDAGNEVLFKMQDDPRVTTVGKFLRKTSLDELPQLLNILIGTMSIVGPRPPLPREAAQFNALELHKFDSTPGLTGLWQVMGRSTLSWNESIRLDLLYVQSRCIALDVRIFFRTFKVLASQEGAY